MNDNEKFFPVIEEIEVLLAEMRDLATAGPNFMILHRFRATGNDCLPGEEVAGIWLVHRSRKFPLSLSLASRLLFNYLAQHRHLPQSANQILAGMTTDPFYANHGANAKSGKRQIRRFSYACIKEYAKRIRQSLAVAFREAGINLDASEVLKSEVTETNHVNYRMRINVTWIHND